MAEQTFRSPGFFDQEIDLSGRKTSVSGIPAGVVGTSEKGPAFVPVTIGSFADFESKFGTLDPKRFGPYAVQKWLENRTACTYVRVLGAGANETSTHISDTRVAGVVSNAGFQISGSLSADTSGVKSDNGMVQFIVAKHNAVEDEATGFPIFTDNRSVNNANEINLIRGMVLLASGTRMLVSNHDGYWANRSMNAEVGAIGESPLSEKKFFKLILSSTSDTYGTDEGEKGVRILTASLDPNEGSYIGKILNTDPQRFGIEQHLLYADFAVEHDIAPVIHADDMPAASVAVLSGSCTIKSTDDPKANKCTTLFGRFDTRYTTPKTTPFISQPYGKAEFDLFHFEALDDGAYANEKFKVSIAGLKASPNEKIPYGSFEVQVRSFEDSDSNSAILERFPNCSLDPNSDRYIARVIGDKKVRYDFDQEDPDERRLVVTGKYPNVSRRVRVVMSNAMERAEVPKDALPFGFRGVPTLKTSDSLTDGESALKEDGTTYGVGASQRLGATDHGTTGSIVPPLPYRVKVTRGPVAGPGAATFLGDPGDDERVDGRLYWGVKTDRLPVSSSNDTQIGIAGACLNPNAGAGINPLVRAYTKFVGIEKLDSLVTGSGKDVFNNNKFSLAKVALYNTADTLSDVTVQVTGSANEHMLQAAYVRNGVPDPTTYTVTDGTRDNRITLASLIATSSQLFNRFTSYAKFTSIFHGGFDGLNILDTDQFYFRDRALSADAGGKNPGDGVPDIGLEKNAAGTGRRNNNVYSLRKGIEIITNPISSRINLLAVPGIREPYVTDHAADMTKDYGLAMYLMDIPEYDKDATRMYDDTDARSNVTKTISQFESRAIDNNYTATYFPDVFITDNVNNRVVEVPPSVAALGALAFNDRTQQVWFAPAGFNRGALSFVSNVENRLSASDRDDLYDARINPIATFPRAGFVVFGQKTLQVAQSALDRINVRRMLIDVKRRISAVALKLVFEQNNTGTRARFVAEAAQQLTFVQAGQGIEAFKVVCDETNNTSADIEQNRMRGQITVVPTRAVEFIAVDFIITNSGVTFE